MAHDRYTKLELSVRTVFRKFLAEKLSAGKQHALVIPGFEVPRGGSVDLILGPKGGTTLGLMQRSDYVIAYKHSVGQLIGVLAHYHQMKDRELREGLRASQAHAAEGEEGAAAAPTFDALKVSKRLAEDRKEGEITLALVTELPEVPQQARELEANFYPIAVLLDAWLPSPVKKKKLCVGVEFYAVDANADPPRVAVLLDALRPMLDHTPSAT
jgi:hypothetical protein